MKLQHIELNQLKTSDANVRKHGAKDGLDELVASIRSLGVIQPLLVRANGTGFEVIAGQRRLLACQALKAQDGQCDPLPCAVLENGDDATAIEASLAENVARLPMDEIDQYEAFAALKKQGRSVADIAAQFGVTELLVTKRLAIANLIAPVLAAYRNDEIDISTLRALTMATKKQQKEWIKLLRDPDQYAPTGGHLKAWLFGGQLIPVSSALFPVESYDGATISDLFGEERYFDDPKKFWKLQTEIIIEKQAAYLDDGWNDVEIMDIGRYWQPYDKVRRRKDQGGRVYISCAANGEVEFHEGWLTDKEAAKIDRALEKAKANSKGEGGAEAPSRPELTKAAIRYLDLHRQVAVRMELLKAPQIALRLIAASAIGSAPLWDVCPENQSANGNKAIAESVESSKAQQSFDAERQAVGDLLGLKHKDGFLIQPTWQKPEPCAIFAQLLELSDKDVLRVLAFLMAETLAAGSAEVEALGHILKVDAMAYWQPDQTFFDLLRDKQAINAMLAETGGKHAARTHVTETAKAQKEAIAACLTGTKGYKKAAGWMPRYMRFPMQPYTKRKGLPAADRWNAVKKLFAAQS